MRKMAEEVDKLIGYCGYNCHLCAARSEDIAVRQKMVDAWRNIQDIKTIQQKMFIVLAARMRDHMRIKNVKQDHVQLKKGWKAVHFVMNSHVIK